MNFPLIMKNIQVFALFFLSKVPSPMHNSLPFANTYNYPCIISFTAGSGEPLFLLPRVIQQTFQLVLGFQKSHFALLHRKIHDAGG